MESTPSFPMWLRMDVALRRASIAEQFPTYTAMSNGEIIVQHYTLCNAMETLSTDAVCIFISLHSRDCHANQTKRRAADLNKL